MIETERADPLWLQRLLETAVANNWCTRINCTTCPSEELRLALDLMERQTGQRPRFLPMSEAGATKIVNGLVHCRPLKDQDWRFEDATRWVLYEVWLRFGTQYDDRLIGSWAGKVLDRMKAHHKARTEARRQHDARQRLKQKDWKA